MWGGCGSCGSGTTGFFVLLRRDCLGKMIGARVVMEIVVIVVEVLMLVWCR